MTRFSVSLVCLGGWKLWRNWSICSFPLLWWDSLELATEAAILAEDSELEVEEVVGKDSGRNRCGFARDCKNCESAEMYAIVLKLCLNSKPYAGPCHHTLYKYMNTFADFFLAQTSVANVKESARPPAIACLGTVSRDATRCSWWPNLQNYWVPGSLCFVDKMAAGTVVRPSLECDFSPPATFLLTSETCSFALVVVWFSPNHPIHPSLSGYLSHSGDGESTRTRLG